jgi:hypothetical protein
MAATYFSTFLVYALRKVHENKGGLKLNGDTSAAGLCW